MSGVNPFASSEHVSDLPPQSALGRQLGSCRLGVVLVTVMVTLCASGYALRGVVAVMELASHPRPATAEHPLFQSLDAVHELSYRYALQRLVTSLVTAGLLAAFAFLLGTFSRRLRGAARGEVALPALFQAQAACWLMAAFLALAMLVRTLVPILN